jgi:hypothetical protein
MGSSSGSNGSSSSSGNHFSLDSHQVLLKMFDIILQLISLYPISHKNSQDHKEFENHASSGKDNVDLVASDDMYTLFLSGKSGVSFRLLKDIPVSILHYIFSSLTQFMNHIFSNPSSPSSSSSVRLLLLDTSTRERIEQVRLICLIFIIEKCSRNKQVFDSIGILFFKQLLDDWNASVSYFAAKFLMKQLASKFPDEYVKFMKQLISKAQKRNHSDLLHNPYLQLVIED